MGLEIVLSVGGGGAKAAAAALLLAVLLAAIPAAMAQEEHPALNEATTPAKLLFAAKSTPAAGPATPIGYYSRGCLSGAVQLPSDGPHWQVMRPSRNRNWGDPSLVAMIERLANGLADAGGWPGLLIGDMSQPRGGPMPNGHASHQVGLDVDIWLTPFPDHTLTQVEREKMPPVNVVADSWTDVDPKVWSPQDVALIKSAAEQPQVERIFVNPAIKKALCRDVKGDRSWLHKVRPWYGHNEHIHVRIACPATDKQCRHQEPIPPGDGCDRSLTWWFSHEPHGPLKPPEHPRPGPKLADLPAACKAVLNAP